MASATTEPRRSLFWPTVAALCAFAVLVGLGGWQVERLYGKQALLAQFDAAINAEPAELGEVLAAYEAGDNPAFRRVSFRASPVSAQVLHLYWVSHGEAGWRVIQAVETGEGARLLLDRGFVPEAMKNEAPRPLAPEFQIVGRVQLPETPKLFTPDNESSRDIWYWRDLAAMARAFGLDPAATAPFYVLLESPALEAGWPRPEATPERPANPHLGYALTWFGLAAALAGVYMAFALNTLRSRHAP